MLGPMSEQALDELVRDSGLDLGRVDGDGVTVLTASTARLQAALATHADVLFPETEALRRMH